MENAKGSFVLRSREIGIKFFQRRRNQQSFVNDRAMREGGDIEILDLLLAHAFLDLVAGQKKETLVLVAADSRTAADQGLFDPRHGRLRLVAKQPDIDWHV